jgi:hypothetical protein
MTNSELEPKSFKKFLGFSFAFKKQSEPAPVKVANNIVNVPSEEKTQTNENKSEAFRLHQEQLNRKTKQKEVKEKLDILFNGLLNARDEPKALMVLERGYQIDSDQAIRLMDVNFKDPKFKDAILKRYESHIKEEISSTIKELIKRFSTPSKGSYDANEEEDNESYERQESIGSFMTKATAVWKYTDQINNLKDPEYALQFRDECNSLKEVVMYNYYEEYDYDYGNEETENKFISILDSFIAFVEKEHQSTILDKFSQELDSYALGFNSFETVKENMVSGMLESVKKFNEFDLPVEAQKLMNEITEISNDISPHSLNVEQTLEFNNLYKKRFPQVLEEYVSISPRYKEKLKSHDENPDNILMESLVEIKGKLDEIADLVQGNKHTRQKITRQYLKNM